jgi:cellulose/xylan binding protein with CBM9 domain
MTSKLCIALSAIILILSVLACNAPGRGSEDAAATVNAVYVTITAQAGTPLSITPPATSIPLPIKTAIPGAPTSTPPPPADRGSLVTIKRCANDITVDAKDTDWTSQSGVTSFNLDQATYGLANWTGASDLSGTAQLCWTDAAMFLLVKSTDDVHMQNQRGNTSWKGDEVEFLYDNDLKGDFYNDVWNKDDFQIGLNPGDFATLVRAPFQYHPSEGAPPGVEMAAAKLDKGVLYEAKIVWGALGAPSVIGQTYGLCIALSDNDKTDEAVQQSMVSHCKGLQVSNPMTWQSVTFAP